MLWCRSSARDRHIGCICEPWAFSESEATVVDVIVIDDDPASRNALRMALGRQGYSVVCAENGKRALELLRADRPHLVLCDIVMPDMSGPQLVDEALAEGLIDAHRIVMVSALALERASHASWCITKPVDVDLLLRVVEELAGPPPRRAGAA